MMASLKGMVKHQQDEIGEQMAKMQSSNMLQPRSGKIKRGNTTMNLPTNYNLNKKTTEAIPEEDDK